MIDAFILSYKRAREVLTVDTLRRCGYTGRIHVVVDTTDPQIDEYKQFYKSVVVFNKADYISRVDTMDNLFRTDVVVYARVAVYDIAKEMGLKEFIVLDDDYVRFNHRVTKNLSRIVAGKNSKIRDLDQKIAAMLEFYRTDERIKILSIGQGGDYFDKQLQLRSKRKAMNFFLCSTERPVKFLGTINEDVNMYVYEGLRGSIILTVFAISLDQMRTQAQPGGLTEIYRTYGTYMKSFYPKLLRPLVVEMILMGVSNLRVHHQIRYGKICPKIIPERFRYVTE